VVIKFPLTRIGSGLSPLSPLDAQASQHYDVQYLTCVERLAVGGQFSLSSEIKLKKTPMGGARSWQDGYTRKITYRSSKLDQTDRVFVYDHSSSVGLCVQDYKSLRV